MNPIRTVIRHPAIAGALGSLIGYRAAGGSLFAQCLAAVSAAMYMDAKEVRKPPLLTGTLTPAKPGDVAVPPSPTPPSNNARVIVFALAAVAAGVVAFAITRSLLQ
jgi:hypothetical protein